MSESNSPLANRSPHGANRGLWIVTQGTKTSWPGLGYSTLVAVPVGLVSSNVVMSSVTIWMPAMICIGCCRSDVSVWAYGR
ncbi:hypothetical protein M405DRAFT_818465 [Rhizopogon salebrosus TDB-379]|nr:hypothetical protein M405DRAFT_818465 [Rhizopogon salebrosus TDB-379]